MRGPEDGVRNSDFVSEGAFKGGCVEGTMYAGLVVLFFLIISRRY